MTTRSPLAARGAGAVLTFLALAVHAQNAPDAARVVAALPEQELAMPATIASINGELHATLVISFTTPTSWANPSTTAASPSTVTTA